VAALGRVAGRTRLEHLEAQQLKVVRFENRLSASAFSFWLIQADKNPSDDVRRVVEWVLASAAELAEPESQAGEAAV
jgi:hypothetical protein